jgi:hypothetical protein
MLDESCKALFDWQCCAADDAESATIAILLEPRTVDYETLHHSVESGDLVRKPFNQGG